MRRLRVLLYEAPENPYMNLAFEEAFARLRAAGITPDTLRIWRNRRAVIIGYFQRAEEEVHLDKARRLGVAVARRFTGGGAVYHDLGNINYAVALGPSPESTRDPIGYLYNYLVRGALNALRILGLNPHLENINDIAVGDYKVSGVAASYRWNAPFLHGALLVSTDLRVLSSILKVSRKKLEDKRVSSVKYRVTLIKELLGRPVRYSEVVGALVKGYEELLGAEAYYDLPWPEELEAARILYEHKYRLEEWNLQRTPAYRFREAERLLSELVAGAR